MQIYLVIKSVGDCHVVTSRYTPNDGRRAVIANAEIDFRSLPGKEIGVMVFVTLIASTICEVPLHAWQNFAHTQKRGKVVAAVVKKKIFFFTCVCRSRYIYGKQNEWNFPIDWISETLRLGRRSIHPIRLCDCHFNGWKSARKKGASPSM